MCRKTFVYYAALFRMPLFMLCIMLCPPLWDLYLDMRYSRNITAFQYYQYYYFRPPIPAISRPGSLSLPLSPLRTWTFRLRVPRRVLHHANASCEAGAAKSVRTVVVVGAARRARGVQDFRLCRGEGTLVCASVHIRAVQLGPPRMPRPGLKFDRVQRGKLLLYPFLSGNYPLHSLQHLRVARQIRARSTG